MPSIGQSAHRQSRCCQASIVMHASNSVCWRVLAQKTLDTLDSKAVDGKVYMFCAAGYTFVRDDSGRGGF